MCGELGKVVFFFFFFCEKKSKSVEWKELNWIELDWIGKSTRLADKFPPFLSLGRFLQVTYFQQKRVMEYKKAQTMERLAQEDATKITQKDRRP